MVPFTVMAKETKEEMEKSDNYLFLDINSFSHSAPFLLLHICTEGWRWVLKHPLKGLEVLWALVSVGTKHANPKPGISILPKQQELIPGWGEGRGGEHVSWGQACLCE